MAILGLVSGCAVPMREAAWFTPDFKPENVFLYAPMLSPDLKRVAVLPLACEDHRCDLRDGCEELDPILQAEVIKTRKFETVVVNSDFLQARTGRPSWMGTEALPPDFFDALRNCYGCDAVLFCQLTVFRAYAPVAVGWRFKLVNARSRQILWAADEVFDAGQRSVLRGALDYRGAELKIPAGEPGEWLMQNSPRRFSQYAAAHMLETLPHR